MSYCLFYWIIELVLCNIGVCLPWFLGICHFSNNYLFPLLRVVVAKYFTTIVLVSMAKIPYLDTTMWSICVVPFVVFSMTSSITWYSSGSCMSISWILISPRFPFCLGELYHQPNMVSDMMATIRNMERNDSIAHPLLSYMLMYFTGFWLLP